MLYCYTWYSSNMKQSTEVFYYITCYIDVLILNSFIENYTIFSRISGKFSQVSQWVYDSNAELAYMYVTLDLMQQRKLRAYDWHVV